MQGTGDMSNSIINYNDKNYGGSYKIAAKRIFAIPTNNGIISRGLVSECIVRRGSRACPVDGKVELLLGGYVPV